MQIFILKENVLVQEWNNWTTITELLCLSMSGRYIALPFNSFVLIKIMWNLLLPINITTTE
jgi:hypothetical protein